MLILGSFRLFYWHIHTLVSFTNDIPLKLTKYVITFFCILNILKYCSIVLRIILPLSKVHPIYYFANAFIIFTFSYYFLESLVNCFFKTFVLISLLISHYFRYLLTVHLIVLFSYIFIFVVKCLNSFCPSNDTILRTLEVHISNFEDNLADFWEREIKNYKIKYIYCNKIIYIFYWILTRDFFILLLLQMNFTLWTIYMGLVFASLHLHVEFCFFSSTFGMYL